MKEIIRNIALIIFMVMIVGITAAMGDFEVVEGSVTDNTDARLKTYLSSCKDEFEYYYTTANLNVRESPSMKATIAKTEPEGTRVKVLGFKNDWAIVKMKDIYYMHSDYLSKSKPKEKDRVCLGKWKITAYCNCEKCCGRWAWGETTSGTMPEEGRTVACNSLPAGTDIEIDKHEYVVEDTGHLGEEHVDIYFNDHDITNDFGVQYKKVYLIK